MMSFLKVKTTWTNAELVPLKLCIATIYLLIGAYFKELVKEYAVSIFILFVVTMIWSMYLWIRKMNQPPSNIS